MTFVAATSDQVKILFCSESTFGELASSPEMTALRVVSESLGQETTIVESQDIVDDRQTAHLIRTAVRAPGDINFQLAYGVYDSLFKAALMSAGWSSDVDIAAGTDVSFAAPSSTLQAITKTAGGFDDFTAGMFVRVSSATNAGNNGIFQIASIASDTVINVINADGVLEASGASVAFKQGGQIVNGVTSESFNFEREYGDLSNEFAQYLGCEVDTLAINLQAEQLITGAINLAGKIEQSATATNANSVVAAPSSTPMNAVENVQAIYEGGVQKDVSAFGFATRNNLRDRSVIGTLGTCGRGAGKFGVSGTLQKYYETKTIMDKHINQTATALACIAVDGAGNGYVFHVPRAKFVGGKRVAGGINTDIVADMSWQAEKDTTSGITFRIQRFEA